METKTVSPEVRKHLLLMQKDEITSHLAYSRIAKFIKDEHNRKAVEKIAVEELHHYETWRSYTGQEIKPNMARVQLYTLLARFLGLTFSVKLLEKGEEKAQTDYSEAILNEIPEVNDIIKEEDEHEDILFNMIDEEALKYAGSVVLGLNDALVELTGALAGLTFALQNTRLVALAGLITGISASFSMAASEYLSQKSEQGEQNPGKSALYTGIAYIFTVLFLTFPYLVVGNYLICLAWTLINAIIVIAVFNYYISVAKDASFKRRFTEMVTISMGVAAISFIVGNLVRTVLGVDV
ncbi:MAG: rubrerythrin family protein [Chloroflexi bacterium]|jgi:VIT1/CCC1 family predicted Fe2+/Mn2+ transporter|nr:rubrerythrin family protein [Chloroflexota bacterium]